ncbi:hypothetical protein ACFXAZ_08055 [Streptomyces sp. NPDC059477]|uniref:hypothetical protein n=1 Tax=Streptomyces sp. NPDC059477 TaxID=3346847 RepID=UPI0036CF7441
MPLSTAGPRIRITAHGPDPLPLINGLANATGLASDEGGDLGPVRRQPMTGWPARPSPAAALTRAQYSGWDCCWCGKPLKEGGVSVGIARGRLGAHVLDIEVYACPPGIGCGPPHTTQTPGPGGPSPTATTSEGDQDEGWHALIQHGLIQRPHQLRPAHPQLWGPPSDKTLVSVAANCQHAPECTIVIIPKPGGDVV